MPQTKKAICTSRSFGQYVSTIIEMGEALSNFASNCASKLRKENSAAAVLTVFIQTNSYNTTQSQYNNSRTMRLPVVTNSTPEIIHYALKALKDIFKSGYAYKKSGIIVTGIVPANAIQQNLFDSVDRVKQTILMQTVDEINSKIGKRKNCWYSPVKCAIQIPATKQGN